MRHLIADFDAGPKSASRRSAEGRQIGSALILDERFSVLYQVFLDIAKGVVGWFDYLRIFNVVALSIDSEFDSNTRSIEFVYRGEHPPRVTQENGGNTGTVQAAETDDPLQVSIPVGNIGSNKAEKFGEFLLFQLDLSGYRRTTALIGFLGYTFLGLFSVVLVSGLALTVERNDDLVFANEELHQAFEELGAVLWEAPVPYTQLDSEDRIRNCNRALCDFLGYGYSVLVSTKFRDLIHDDDKAKYDEVQQKRRENQQVEPYDLRFVKENGDEVVAWIVSAPVPSVSG